MNKDKPELQCNGKCHLSKQLQLVSSETGDTDGNLMAVIVSESFFPVYFQTENSHDFDNTTIIGTKHHNFYYTENYSFSLSFQLLKPPIS